MPLLVSLMCCPLGEANGVLAACFQVVLAVFSCLKTADLSFPFYFWS